MKVYVYTCMILAGLSLALAVFTKLGWKLLLGLFGLGPGGLLQLTIILLLFGINFACLDFLGKKQ